MVCRLALAGLIFTGCASVKPVALVLSTNNTICVQSAIDALWDSYDSVSALMKSSGRKSLEPEWVSNFCDAHHWISVYRQGTNQDAAIQVEAAIGTLRLIAKQAEDKKAAEARVKIKAAKPKWRQ